MSILLQVLNGIKPDIQRLHALAVQFAEGSAAELEPAALECLVHDIRKQLTELSSWLPETEDLDEDEAEQAWCYLFPMAEQLSQLSVVQSVSTKKDVLNLEQTARSVTLSVIRVRNQLEDLMLLLQQFRVDEPLASGGMFSEKFSGQ
ncbi:hypothetical protein [Oceanimonas sp. CAM02]|uniref:hypothetical protein n=1 Tax=Oceanimonas sp. CAM02 TaxID=3080336 RepID=UPI0029356C98|nr:hypothetical protein [Oceanimonas sp. CAM02]MDV2858281.1 hypothetical protein [Oceanimonas sp. CAM02]